MKIAVIARHFPPAISGGARRPHVLVQALGVLGHETYVVAPALPTDVEGLPVPHPAEERSDTGIVGESRVKDPIWRKWQRDFTLWPDPDRWWANKVIEQAETALTRFNPDIIITTSPPESVHHIGAVLSKRLKAKWIGDFRDNWLRDPLRIQREKSWRKSGETLLARKWIRQMDLACAPTSATLRELRAYAPKTKLYLYPQLAFQSPPLAEQKPLKGWSDLPSGALKALHIGSFTLSDPNRTIDATIAEFTQAKQKLPHLHLCLAGRLSTEEHSKIVNLDQAHWLGLLDPKLAVSLLTEADALLLVTRSGTSAVPGKLSEYAASRRPIIVIGDGPWRETTRVPNEISFDQIASPSGSLKDYQAPDPLVETAKLLDELT